MRYHAAARPRPGTAAGRARVDRPPRRSTCPQFVPQRLLELQIWQLALTAPPRPGRPAPRRARQRDPPAHGRLRIQRARPPPEAPEPTNDGRDRPRRSRRRGLLARYGTSGRNYAPDPSAAYGRTISTTVWPRSGRNQVVVGAATAQAQGCVVRRHPQDTPAMAKRQLARCRADRQLGLCRVDARGRSYGLPHAAGSQPACGSSRTPPAFAHNSPDLYTQY